MSAALGGGARTPAGRAVRRAVRGLAPRSAVGRIAVVLTAEIGGAVGDSAYRVLRARIIRGRSAAGGGWPYDGAGDADQAERAERARRYAAEALREQREAGRRAEEAYRRAKAEARSGPDREDAGAHERQRRTKTLPDYYEVLEVSPRARQSVIDKAYRALMREDHPDQGGDVARAQLVNEAYEILGDPSRRAAYDREMGVA